jgi:hypothetical protein
MQLMHPFQSEDIIFINVTNYQLPCEKVTGCIFNFTVL